MQLPQLVSFFNCNYVVIIVIVILIWKSRTPLHIFYRLSPPLSPPPLCHPDVQPTGALSPF